MWHGYFVFSLFIVSANCNEFLSSPTTIKTKENNTVLLPCYLQTLTNDGSYAIGVKWYKNQVLVADSGVNSSINIPPRHILWNNGSLEIHLVEPEDTGEYMCEISRSSPWGVVRQRHAIEVLHPPSVEPFPKSGFLQVKLGERVQISCQANGVPYPLITWLSKGEELKLINRELLSFTASNRTLAGIYECIASNGVGEPARSQIELNIIYPPEVTSDKFWIHTGPGLRAQLECVVSANPQAQVTWLKGKVEVPLDNRIFTLIDGERHLLLIRKVQRSDFGIYTCQVRNELGENRINIQLSGVPNPGIFKKTIDDDISNKNTYTLIWEVDSYTPIIEYSLWFRPYRTGGNLVRTDWTKLTIPAEHRSGPVYSKSYTLRELKEKTVYEAVLISRNRFGWSKPSSVFRFATVGAEVSKDMFTTIQIGLPNDENNAIPLNHISSKGNAVLPIVNFSTLFLVNCYVIYV